LSLREIMLDVGQQSCMFPFLLIFITVPYNAARGVMVLFYGILDNRIQRASWNSNRNDSLCK